MATSAVHFVCFCCAYQVKIFKDYTQENCLLECRSRLLLDRCGCLPYFYPRLDLVMRENKNREEEEEEERSGGKNGTLGLGGGAAECTWEGWQCLKNSTGQLLRTVFLGTAVERK